jgi:hypothetical protein
MNIKEIIIGYILAKLIWSLFIFGVVAILGIFWLILYFLDRKQAKKDPFYEFKKRWYNKR